jgi:hypothetical protein
MGGLSTSLLFSVFESWYITAHRQRGFPDELMQQTFSYASVRLAHPHTGDVRRVIRSAGIM